MIKKVFSIIIVLSPLLLAAMSARAQDYSYDGNGNLANDANKQIASIHYNHLNLVDTIVYTDGRKIIYTYSGSGQKLREQAIAANGTTVKKRDYVAHVLYVNDTLQEVKHEDGRLVPVQPGNSVSVLEYQYHLDDHLGNVRATLTSLPDTDKGTATLESSNLSAEEKRFQRYDDARRISSALFDHTNGNSIGFSVRLNGSANEKYGLAKSLSVMPGDKIQTEVYAKYPDPNSSNWTGILPMLMSQITGNVAGVVVDGASYSSSTVSFPSGLAGLQSKTDNGQAPPAYLNWLIFDRHYKFLTGGFVQISTAARETGSDVEHEHLSSPVITITKPGFVYVYLSNEVSGSAKDVFFDDFTVTLDKGPVIAQTDYDPFGLTFNKFERENAVSNNFLYNGKELQDDFELNWNDFGARMQDPAIGRWHVVDPLTEKYADLSPYNYARNNPIKYVDPDGKDFVIWYDKNQSYKFNGVLPDEKKWPKNPFVRAFLEAYKYDIQNGGGKSLQAIASSKSIHVDVRLGIGKIAGKQSSVKDTGASFGAVDFNNGYNGDKRITWAASVARVDGDQKISSATILEGLAYQALKDATERDKFLDAIGTDPSGEFHHKIDREVALGPETETARANGEIGSDETVTKSSNNELYPTEKVYSRGYATPPLFRFAKEGDFWLYVYSRLGIKIE